MEQTRLVVGDALGTFSTAACRGNGAGDETFRSRALSHMSLSIVACEPRTVAVRFLPEAILKRNGDFL